MSSVDRLAIDPVTLEQIAKIVGDTHEGLTGTEIEHALRSCGIPDVDPTNTKWRRLYNALADFQNKTTNSDHVGRILERFMHPASYRDDEQEFEYQRSKLNGVLPLCGLWIGEDGRVVRKTKVTTLSEVAQLSNRMKAKLEQRGAHPEVLRYCDEEILAQSTFHSVLEGVKSVFSRLRDLSGLPGDGEALIAPALCGSAPRVTINRWNSESLKSEQSGFANLLRGLYSMVRNPLSHNPRAEWSVTEQDALDILTIVSLAHRKLDSVQY